MKNKILVKYFLLVVISTTLSSAVFAQKIAKTVVLERNVRAQLEFLAGDAMQGRGSGTMFERIAAEYLGSQMMQFGVAPAGDKDANGKDTYVQTVEVPGRSRLDSMTVTGWPGDALAFKRDYAVLSVSTAKVAGELQKLKPGETAKKGAIVLLMVDPKHTFSKFQSGIGKLFADGAVAVLIAETEEIRANWDDFTGNKPALGRRGNVFAMSTSAIERVANLADGTTIGFEGKFGEPVETNTWNAVGKIAGSDPKLSADVIVLSAHLDHLGVRENVRGDDKIFNGADDDASGCVAVLELARYLASKKAPKRTVYLVFFGSEEAGGFGARHFVDKLAFPKVKLVANLQFEMIGRPDSKVKPEELWLTGYERSNLGEELAKRGAKLVADPHPEENFFQRSDNITLARQGIVAHTVSSFGLHTDYHRVTDETKTIDYTHMTRSINSMVAPVKWLVNSNFVPAWKEGMKP